MRSTQALGHPPLGLRAPGQVCDARPQIAAIAGRLRSRTPIDARGVAYLRELLCNGDSPVYMRSPAGALAAELHTVLEMLDVPV
jgi:hypothetical protein